MLTGDLSKYEAIIEELKDVDLEMEEDMDLLSLDSASHSNLRFDKTGRAKEFDDERDHHTKIALLLQRHIEVAARLTEVQDDNTNS